jgi:acid phosphatase (class A)
MRHPVSGLLAASLVACDYKPNANPLSSYPSGHATLAYSDGLILEGLMPEKAQAIVSRAKEYAYSRLVCGAHYASDLEASHVLGTELVMLMMKEPKFAADFDAAKAELRAAGLIH